MSREKTNSITHLVKIVAEEVIAGRVNKTWESIDGWSDKIIALKQRLRDSEAKYKRVGDHQVVLSDKINTLEKQVKKLFAKSDEMPEFAKECLDSIQSNLEKAGRVWTMEEDAILIHEVRTAVATIAKSHQRSAGAIRNRIEDKIIKINALGKGCLSV